VPRLVDAQGDQELLAVSAPEDSELPRRLAFGFLCECRSGEIPQQQDSEQPVADNGSCPTAAAGGCRF